MFTPRCFLWSFLSLCLLGLSGCFSSAKYNEFVQTINFTSLDTYMIQDVEIVGNDVKAYESEMITSTSTDLLTVEMGTRDFSSVEAEPDFIWKIRWEKKATFNPSPLDSINDFRDELNRRDDPSQQFARRWHLTLEAYLPDNPAPFWQKELPNLFDAIELTEGRVFASIQRAVKNFPTRVEKDPNLPHIE